MEKTKKSKSKHKRKGTHSKGEKKLLKLIKTDKKPSSLNDPNYCDETDGSINEAIWEDYEMKSKMFDYELIR